MIDKTEKVLRAEDLLAACAPKSIDEGASSTVEDVCQDSVKTKAVIPRGKPKSGRVWKEPKQRFSSIVKSRGIRLSFDKKKQLRDDLKKAKELSRDIKAQRDAERQAKIERRKENLKKAEENRKKSEVVQVIKNTAKIKRMKKKQLRMIEKRDTLKNK
ncbi:hypothetical protein QAD02_014890 [Eretmocerus hayati]|uniref:Uncharacterized protein n=1 Tax=Eretmocerus hayati TaxID=131215 RepID=A0ACC2P6T5_9HYME|nr:hypothetical protein QAD02_014890 [Eretmocerus hayati]